MVRINFLDFNRASGLMGLILISLAVTLLIFSIIYFVEGSGWSDSSDDDEDFDDIAANWYAGGIISLVLAVFFFIGGVVLLIVNFVSTRRNKREGITLKMLWNRFDLNLLWGPLPLIMIPTGLIFLFNGVLYKIEARKWENAATANTIWKLREASAWHTSAMWMFLIAIFLICGAAFLLLLNYWVVRRCKKVSPDPDVAMVHQQPRPPYGYGNDEEF